MEEDDLVGKAAGLADVVSDVDDLAAGLVGLADELGARP